MNILIITPFFPPDIGGVETVSLEKAIKFSENGHNVSVLTAKTQKEKRNYYNIGKVSVYRYKTFNLPEINFLPKISKIGFTINAFPILSKIIKIHKIQIILCETHVFPITIVSYLLNTIIFKRPIFITVLGRFNLGMWYTLEKIYDKIVTKHLFYKVDKLICSSKELMGRFLFFKIKKERLKVIPNGVDIDFFKKIPNANYFEPYLLGKENYKKVLFAGRLDEQKGLIYLLRAIPKVLKHFKDVHFFIMGNGSLEIQLKKLAKELDINDYVTFLNSVPFEQLPYIYSSVDFLCFPSLFEGFSTIIGQTLSIGLVIIASKVEGILDAIRENENGFIFEPRNVKELSRKLLMALNMNTENIKLISKNNRKLAKQKYSWDKIICQFIKLFSNSSHY